MLKRFFCQSGDVYMCSVDACPVRVEAFIRNVLLRPLVKSCVGFLSELVFENVFKDKIPFLMQGFVLLGIYEAVNQHK